ncbi:MAG: DUF4124 domain-containing protein [Moraxellaceae bacterium]
MKGIVAGVVIVAALAAAGWHWREPIRARLASALPASVALPGSATATPDVLYRWTDEHGVVHYDQRPGRGEAVVFDGGRITPLATPPAPLLPAAPEAAEAPRREGSQLLHGLRDELKRNAETMSEAKSAAMP